MQKIITAKGNEFDVWNAGSIGNRYMYIDFVGSGLVEIVNVFGDPEETATLVHVDDTGTRSREYAGFTMLGEARIAYETGEVQIRLDRQIDQDNE